MFDVILCYYYIGYIFKIFIKFLYVDEIVLFMVLVFWFSFLFEVWNLMF